MLQEEQKDLDEILAKRAKKGKKVEEKPMEEKTIMHCKLILLPVSCKTIMHCKLILLPVSCETIMHCKLILLPVSCKTIMQQAK